MTTPRLIVFLPGSLEEKLAPWMQPIHDALEMLSDLNMGHDHRRSTDLMRSGSIVVEALSYIRGRSIANQFMVVGVDFFYSELPCRFFRILHGARG